MVSRASSHAPADRELFVNGPRGAIHFGVTSHTADKQAHVALLFAGGLSHKLTPALGVGVFGDALVQTAGIEHPNTLVEQHGGGTLSIRFGLVVELKLPL